MKRLRWGAVGGFAVAALGFSSAAEAQCQWTGYSWSCPSAPAAQNYPPRYGAMDWGQPGFGYYRGQSTGPYAASGAASHMGPEPGGGFRHLGSEHVGHTD
jgi:hypothetical protein